MKDGGILIELKQAGERVTKTREGLVRIFEEFLTPQTEHDLRHRLNKLGIEVNKTTVYRELDFLKNRGLIREIDFGDGKKRYELNNRPHHHHLVCIKCEQVADVYMENDLRFLENKIRKENDFTITRHSLEFFGVCKVCQTN